MSRRPRIFLFVALSVAQLAAAASSIAKYETVLASGTRYRIQVAPVDPADAFRGRYVAVRPSITVPAPIAAETEQLLQSVQSRRSRAYVRLSTDELGFARAAAVMHHPPEQGDYLEIDHAWPVWTPRPGEPGQSEMTGYSLGFSFDRYYMNEAAAPAAERQYAETVRRDANRRAWLNVRVKDGVGVIEGLFIDGVPIEQVAPPPE